MKAAKHELKGSEYMKNTKATKGMNRKAQKGTTPTINAYGERAYNLADKEKLTNLVCTCMFGEDKFYAKGGETETEIARLCERVGTKYVLQLANYARNELNLRGISTYLLACAAKIESTKPYVREYAPKIISRADELYEVLACYTNFFGKPIPNSLKKGIGDAFGKFDEYQLSKYNKKSTFTLKDVVCLTHPPRTDLTLKILEGTLKTPETWEVRASTEGNNAAMWDDMIRNKKLGYMATLRNLNNMVKTGITEVDAVCNYLTNPTAIKNSKQFPYRFISAFNALGGTASEYGLRYEPNQTASDMKKKFLSAINTAMMISAENIPKISGKTIILSDNSGSTRTPYSNAKKIGCDQITTMRDAGNLMALLAFYACDDALFGVFGTKCALIPLSRTRTIMENFEIVSKIGDTVGGSTVMPLLDQMISKRMAADRMIICSDLQIGAKSCGECTSVPSMLKMYRDTVNPKFQYYSLCFNGYGNNIVVEDNAHLITGFSESVLKFISSGNGQDTEMADQMKYIEENF